MPVAVQPQYLHSTQICCFADTAHCLQYAAAAAVRLSMVCACRLRQAHKCSQQTSKPAYARPNDAEAGGGEVAVQDDDQAQRIHGEFMQMALQLVDGRLDSSQYEDSCRQLLGMASCFPYLVCCLHSLHGITRQHICLTPACCRYSSSTCQLHNASKKCSNCMRGVVEMTCCKTSTAHQECVCAWACI